LAQGGSAPAVLNAANEVVVGAFLDKRINFIDIPDLIRATLEKHQVVALNSIEEVLQVDRWARRETSAHLETLD
jgi:1-deoxy-D-xylulose-5-phosphate reductoisomerase